VSSNFSAGWAGESGYSREAATKTHAEQAMDGALQQDREEPTRFFARVLSRLSRGGLAHGGRITFSLAALATVLGTISFLIGPAHLSAGELFSALLAPHGTATIIAREIRLPRALLALVVGAALGASGGALQGLFRNPLADPGVTGVTSSAGFGAVVAMYFGFAAINPLVLPASAIAGALATSTILYFLSRSGAERTALVLAGAAIASLATAMTALAMSLAPNPYAISEMVRWMMGSLKDCTLGDLALAAPPVALGILLLMTSARSLDALTLGEEAAQSLGVDVHGVRRRVVIGVALATGAATAAAGAVSFVGLVVPHLLRPFYGYEPARLIWPSALGGAVLVSAADIAVRLIAPDGQLLVGVMTAMIGAPFFIWLILRMRRDT
jgi:iron complex transport system permease protein